MKYIALVVLALVATGCASKPTTKKVYDKVGPAPFTYSDCMRLNGNEVFCRKHATIELAARK